MKRISVLLCALVCLLSTASALALTKGVYTGNGNYGDVVITPRGSGSYLIETCATYGSICHTMRGILVSVNPDEFQSSQASLIVYYGNNKCVYDVSINVFVQDNMLFLSDYAPKNLPNSAYGCPVNLEYANYIETEGYSLQDELIPWKVDLPKDGGDPVYTAVTINKTKEASFLMQCQAPSTDIEMMLQVNDELWLKADQAVNLDGKDLKVVAFVDGKMFDLANWVVTSNNLLIRLDKAMADEITALKQKYSVIFDISTVDNNGVQEPLGRFNFSLKGSNKALTRIEGYCAGVVNGERAIQPLR